MCMWPIFCMTGPCPTAENKKKGGKGHCKGRWVREQEVRVTLSNSRENFMKVSLQTAATEGILSAGLKP